MQDPELWAQAQWGKVELGDQRRSKRAVKLGAALASAPDKSLPVQIEGNWADVRAAYRLLDSAPVTHAALTAPHRAATRAQAGAVAGPVLFIQDTTQLDYTGHRATSGLGPIGNGHNQGLLVHSCLAVVPQPDGQNRLLGLAAQRVWTRPPVGRKQQESQDQRQRRARESEVWSETLLACGPVPQGACWIGVGDAESDIFGHMRQAREAGFDYLLRAGQNRRVEGPDGRSGYLFEVMRALPAQAWCTLHLASRGGQRARTVELSVAWTALRICAPYDNPSERGFAAQSCWGVRAWGEELEWVLLSSRPVEDAAQACERLDWYAGRWLIEEYHKGLKTGCAIERRRLESAKRITALLGFVALVAVRLLQAREAARRTPEALVRGSVPAEFVRIIAHKHKLSAETMTHREFWRGVAKLGGFLGRRRDGEPGWQSLWTGLLRLQDMAEALAIADHTHHPSQNQDKCG
jgi:hypothetical protein